MTIEERLMKLGGELEQVKRRNRKTVVGMIACAAVAVVALVLPMTRGDQTLSPGLDMGSVIRAEKFVLLDGQGRERAAMAMDKDWGPGLYTFDEHGEPRVVLYSKEDGGTGLILYDQRFNLWMSSTSVGSSLVLLDGLTARAELDLADYGSSLSLADERGQTRVLLSTIKKPELVLVNENGDPIWKTP